MDKPEAEQMTRLGQMLGKGQAGVLGTNYINPWGMGDYKQQGDDLMTSIQGGDMKQILSHAAPNAPLRQAYDLVNGIKQKVTGKQLDAEDMKLLVDVLKTAHKGTNMNVNSIRALWANVTGVIDFDSRDPAASVNNDAKQQTLNYDVHTPLHLLKQITSVGNGVFGMPANSTDIKEDSAKLLQQLYPDQFQQLYQKRYGHAYGQQQPQATTTQPAAKKKKNPGGTGPGTQPPNASGNTPEMEAALQDLQTALGMPDTDPVAKQKAIQAANQKLHTAIQAKLKPPTPIPPAPTSGTSP